MLGMGQAAGADIYLRRGWFGLLTQNRGGLIQTAEQQCAWTNLLLWACKQENLLVLSSNPKFAFWALVDQNVIKHSDCGVFLENSIYFTVFIIWVDTYLTKYCESPFFWPIAVCTAQFILYMLSTRWFWGKMARFPGRTQLQDNLSQSKLAEAAPASLTFLFSSSCRLPLLPCADLDICKAARWGRSGS